MKFIFKIIALMLISQMTRADAVIFSGLDVLTLKPNIDLFRTAKILGISVDPTVTPTLAPKGSLALSTSTGFGYTKNDAGSTTNWTLLGSAAGPTPYNWAGYMPSPCATTQSAAAANAYQDFGTTANSCDVVQTINTNFGTVHAQGSAGAWSPGLVWTPAVTGVFNVCVVTNARDATTGATYGLSLEDSLGTVISRASLNFTQLSSNQTAPHTMCGLYSATSGVAVTFKIRASGNSGDTLVLGLGVTWPHTIDWSIFKI